MRASPGAPRATGANIGMSVVFFKSLYADAEVLAFEPDPRTFSQLEENVQANRLKARRRGQRQA
jgi:FkbM family methyltransferase